MQRRADYRRGDVMGGRGLAPGATGWAPEPRCPRARQPHVRGTARAAASACYVAVEGRQDGGLEVQGRLGGPGTGKLARELAGCCAFVEVDVFVSFLDGLKERLANNGGVNAD